MQISSAHSICICLSSLLGYISGCTLSIRDLGCLSYISLFIWFARYSQHEVLLKKKKKKRWLAIELNNKCHSALQNDDIHQNKRNTVLTWPRKFKPTGIALGIISQFTYSFGGLDLPNLPWTKFTYPWTYSYVGIIIKSFCTTMKKLHAIQVMLPFLKTQRPVSGYLLFVENMWRNM